MKTKLLVLCLFGLALALALAGCATAPVVVHAPAGYALDQPWAQATALLPVHLKAVDETDRNYHTGGMGEVHVWVVPWTPPGQAGHAHQRPCSPVVEVRATASNSVLAHELGHALGLEHLNRKGNVMQPYGTDRPVSLTREQKQVTRLAAEVLRLCRRIKR